jgi:arylsulfatase A-like enzyme
MTKVFRCCVRGFVVLAVLGLLAGAGAARAETAPERSNIVFFLVDDLGWADLGCYGSSFYETPQIDALAASGMRFTDAYSAGSVCSPTRAALLTGRHPVRIGITDWIPGMPASRAAEQRLRHIDDLDHLPLEEVTLAEVLRAHGYQTFFAGKWHLGGEGFWPTGQGFDVNIGGCEVGSPPGGYYAPWRNPNLQAKRPDEYLTERLTEESLAFLEARDADRPFLLYLSYYNVHTPITPYRKRIDHFRAKAEAEFTGPTMYEAEHDGRTRTRQDNAEYASMIAAVDESVGTILARLEALGLAENTVVVFSSDNGGLATTRSGGPACNLPLRAGKGWLYEGGIRVPLVVRAPGVTRPGSVCRSPVVSMDVLPTVRELAGLPARADAEIDGVSIVPLLEGGEMEERTLTWHYPHYHGSMWTPGAAIRRGNWKLIEFYHWEKVELYDLAADPGEKHDLSGAMPAKVQELLTILHGWQKQVGAVIPNRVE